jgi:hypothetical protein
VGENCLSVRIQINKRKSGPKGDVVGSNLKLTKCWGT